VVVGEDYVWFEGDCVVVVVLLLLFGLVDVIVGVDDLD